jgi:hypothetical protein
MKNKRTAIKNNISIWQQTQVGQYILGVGKKDHSSIPLSPPVDSGLVRGALGHKSIMAKLVQPLTRDGLFIGRILNFDMHSDNKAHMKVRALTYLGSGIGLKLLCWTLLRKSGRFSSEFSFLDSRSWLGTTVDDIEEAIKANMHLVPKAILDKHLEKPNPTPNDRCSLAVDILVAAGEEFLLCMERAIEKARATEILSFDMVKNPYIHETRAPNLLELVEEWIEEMEDAETAPDPLHLKQIFFRLEDMGRALRIEEYEDRIDTLDEIAKELYELDYDALHTSETFERVMGDYPEE